MKNRVKSRTPAKLILSGEHAVVYGCPAIAIAIDQYASAEVSWSTPLHLSFNLMGLDFREKVTLEALKRLKHKLQNQYQRFDAGQIHIRDVLKHPFELTLYTAINVIEKIKHHLPMGINIETHSDIPIGCGLGSSAATVVSVIYALSKFLDMSLNLDDYLKLGIESENLQHGHSSGLDIHMVYHGGCLYYQNALLQTRTLPEDIDWYLVQTGKPLASTGECVSHVKPFFTQQNMRSQFTEVTEQLDLALKNNAVTNIIAAIRENHRLLVKIGVVPQPVQNFINQVEACGGAAKICGAGSTEGSYAGSVIMAGLDYNELNLIAKSHGYSLKKVCIDTKGTQLV